MCVEFPTYLRFLKPVFFFSKDFLIFSAIAMKSVRQQKADYCLTLRSPCTFLGSRHCLPVVSKRTTPKRLRQPILQPAAHLQFLRCEHEKAELKTHKSALGELGQSLADTRGFRWEERLASDPSALSTHTNPDGIFQSGLLLLPLV